MSHVAKLFLDRLTPLLALRQVRVVVGILKTCRLDEVVLEGFGKVELFHLHLFVGVECEIWQGIDRKRGKVVFDLFDLIFFFFPSQSIVLLDRSIIVIVVVGGAMAINIIRCMRIIGRHEFSHRVEHSQRRLGGSLFVLVVDLVGCVIFVIVFFVVGIVVFIVVGMVVIFIVFIIVVVVVIDCSSVGSSLSDVIVVVFFVALLCSGVVARLVVLDNVGSDPTNIARRPDATHLHVQHFEGAVCMVICISDEHAVLTSICQLASQWSGIIHNTNFTKNTQV